VFTFAVEAYGEEFRPETLGAVFAWAEARSGGEGAPRGAENESEHRPRDSVEKGTTRAIRVVREVRAGERASPSSSETGR
jgi:hypothetical protein